MSDLVIGVFVLLTAAGYLVYKALQRKNTDSYLAEKYNARQANAPNISGFELGNLFSVIKGSSREIVAKDGINIVAGRASVVTGMQGYDKEAFFIFSPFSNWPCHFLKLSPDLERMYGQGYGKARLVKLAEETGWFGDELTQREARLVSYVERVLGRAQVTIEGSHKGLLVICALNAAAIDAELQRRELLSAENLEY